MYRVGEHLVASASDLVGFVECPHLTALVLEDVPTSRAGRLADPELDVLQRRGLEHEAAYLVRLKAEGKTVVEIATGASTLDGLRASVAATGEAIASGVDVIYQATFLDEVGQVWWRGHADFLELVADPDTGDGSYEAVDTKLAGHVKPSAVLQLCQYSSQLTDVQGSVPESLHVVLGGQQRVSVPFGSVGSYFRLARARFIDAVGVNGGPVTYPHPVEYCGVCRFADRCESRRRADDYLTFVAGLGREQSRKLNTAGVLTVRDLAGLPVDVRVPGVGAQVLARFRQQARLQVQARENPGKPMPYEFVEPSGQDRGLEALPVPSPGDLYFDMEGDPYVGDDGLEYLFGIGWVGADGKFDFRAFWGHDDNEERAAFEGLVDFIRERRAADPGLHVYHYAPYEPTALGRLAGKHGTREDEVDDLLRGRVLVDLYRVVQQGLRIGTESYGLKYLEPLYMRARTGAIVDAGSSIVEYENWLETGDPQILAAIEAYNRDDCESTELLHRWLEERRTEAEATLNVSLQRRSEPELAEAEASELSDDEDDETESLRALADVLIGRGAGEDDEPAGEEEVDEEQEHARFLLGHLLEWHRREDKPVWWQFFSRIDGYEPGDLLDDPECIDGLEFDGIEDHVARSTLYRYRFPTDQEYKIAVGDRPHDPLAERAALLTGEHAHTPGEVTELDGTAGIIVLKRGNNSKAEHPPALMPSGPINTKVLRDAIERVARWAVDHDLDEPGPYRAALDLLMRRPPRLKRIKPGAPLRGSDESVLDATVRLGLALDASYLPIQGPPGTGKTYTAGRAIVELVKAGKRVGITANSHSVIGNLLSDVMKAADERRYRVRAIEKTDDGGCQHPDVALTNSNGDVAAALTGGSVDVVAGTAWLFAREELAGSLDYLFIDEAGQMSLANVVAVSGAAKNLVLIGDPQQLPQPLKGTHPPGVAASALSYVLAGRHTIPPEHGLFLDRTWRMHPTICAFISDLAYDGELFAEASCEQQRLLGDGTLAGSGLRWLPVDHEGNRLSSTEEADAVLLCYQQLLGRQWINQEGKKAKITKADILVVAPYNAQVHTLIRHLPDGARVGTVDKFQGQQAAVSIVSLAASSTEQIPRGMEFLFSMNRLNVAVSRARAVSIVVANPTLLAARCRSVNQMQLVNGVCNFVERAQSIAPAS